MELGSLIDKIPIIRKKQMADKHREVLQKIIDLEGNCLDAKICKDCPFRLKCHPEFLKTPNARPSKEERHHMALRKVMDSFLFSEEDETNKNP